MSADLSSDVIAMIAVIACFVLLLMIVVAVSVCSQFFCDKCRACVRSTCVELRYRLRHRGQCDASDHELCGQEASYGVLWTAGRTYLCFDLIYYTYNIRKKQNLGPTSLQLCVRTM